MRVGFLGAGLIASYHLASLQRSGERVTEVRVFDPDRARAETLAAAAGAGVGVVAASEDGALDGCDAAYVCTWTSEHRRLVEGAAARGLAVFCEKPLATSLADAAAMADCVRRAGVVHQVGLVLRRSPAFTMLRRLAADPANGRVMSIVFRDDQYIPIRGFYRSTWRGDAARAGAGTMLEHSIHDVDLLEWLGGRVASVNARSANFHGIPGIEDTAVATLQFASGAVGSLVSVWHDVDSRPSLRRVEVLCERVWLALESDWLGPVRWMRPDGSEGALEGEALAEAARQVTGEDANPDGAFLRCVRDGRPAFPDFDVALRAHTVMDAIYASAAADGAPRAVT